MKKKVDFINLLFYIRQNTGEDIPEGKVLQWVIGDLSDKDMLDHLEDMYDIKPPANFMIPECTDASFLE